MNQLQSFVYNIASQKMRIVILAISILMSFNVYAGATFCCDVNAESSFLQASPNASSESFEATLDQPTSQFTGSNGVWTSTNEVIRNVHGVDGAYSFSAWQSDIFSHPQPIDNLTLTLNEPATAFGVWISGNNKKVLFELDDGSFVDFTGEDATVFGWKFLGFITDKPFTSVTMKTELFDDEAGLFRIDMVSVGQATSALPWVYMDVIEQSDHQQLNITSNGDKLLAQCRNGKIKEQQTIVFGSEGIVRFPLDCAARARANIGTTKSAWVK